MAEEQGRVEGEQDRGQPPANVVQAPGGRAERAQRREHNRAQEDQGERRDRERNGDDRDVVVDTDSGSESEEEQQAGGGAGAGEAPRRADPPQRLLPVLPELGARVPGGGPGLAAGGPGRDPGPGIGPGGPDLIAWATALVDAQARVAAAAADRQRREDRRDRRREHQRQSDETARRQELAAARRRREDKLKGIPIYKEEEDLEEYLWRLEESLEACQIDVADWPEEVALKLPVSLAGYLREIQRDEAEYADMRARLLRTMGYGCKEAALNWFGLRWEEARKMTPTALLHKGKLLIGRIISPGRLTLEIEAALLMAWVYHLIPTKGRQMLDERDVDGVAGLAKIIEDFKRVEELKKRDDPRRRESRGDESRGVQRGRDYEVRCFRCGKKGHKAPECRDSGPGEARQGQNQVVCYLCGEVGHIKPNCPRKVVKVKTEGAPAVNVKGARKITLIGDTTSTDVVLEGTVGLLPAQFLLDSGATITVVPRALVPAATLDGGRVQVVPFGRPESSLSLPTAKATLQVAGIKWDCVVAVAEDQYCPDLSQVLLSLNLRTERGLQLIAAANGLDTVQSVAQVKTRAQTQREAQEELADQVAGELENPKVCPAIEGADPRGTRDPVTVAEELVTPGTGHAIEVVLPGGAGEPATGPMGSVAIEDTSPEAPGRQSEMPSGPTVSVSGTPEETQLSAGSNDEESGRVLGVEQSASVDRDEAVMQERAVLAPGEEIPPVLKGGTRDKVVAATKADPSLKSVRELARQEKDGYYWHKGLVLRAVRNHMGEVVDLVVVPKELRHDLMVLAHDKCGHIGVKKARLMMARHFWWPGVSRDLGAYCSSCTQCLQYGRGGVRKAPMVARPVATVPFECMAMDLVGPFPKARGGYRYVLTMVCMATRWPEAIPLTNVRASTVADGVMNIFSRTGLPLQLLSDQGAQFVGSLMSNLCRGLGVERLQTTPYHPETNGMLERMHGTLGPMLRKSVEKGGDWVKQLPFALFALRTLPHRDTGISPYELIYGRLARTPLDLIHLGWTDDRYFNLEVGDWSEAVRSRLEVVREVAGQRFEKVVKERTEESERKKIMRTFAVGDQVWVRIPGLDQKLAEAWHGPHTILERVSQVNYRVEVGRRRPKVLHINTLKAHHPRIEVVRRLAVTADEVEEGEAAGSRAKLDGVCAGFVGEELADVLNQFGEVFNDRPGLCKVGVAHINTGDAGPVALSPYRIPVHFQEKVKQEIESLEAAGIIERTYGPWAAPIVPVRKKDGAVRLCIDYRRLNAVTIADPFYMTTLDEILERVGACGVLSKLDLSKGYHQVLVAPEDRDKTSFISPQGKFRYIRMPFGLKNAPAIFQRVMDQVLGPHFRYSAPYLDDILIFSCGWAEHLEHLSKVLIALREAGLTIKRSKCEFGCNKLEYLGHCVGEGCIAIPEHRVSTLVEYVRPRSRKDLRAFLGCVGYYRPFLKHLANHSARLTPATSKTAPSVVVWSPEMVEAFHTILTIISSSCKLTIPVLADMFTLHTDASGLGVGATLNVVRDGKEEAVAFYSRQLQGAQHRYSATELECLAVYAAINHFAHFLHGKHFDVYTDHKALVHILSSRALNRRLLGWVLRLQDFNFTVHYRPGSEMGDADGLSRQSWSSSELMRQEMRAVETTELRSSLDPQGGHKEEGGDVGLQPTRELPGSTPGNQEQEGERLPREH